MIKIRKAIREDSEAIGPVHINAIKILCRSHYSETEIETWARPRKPDFYVESIRCNEFYVVEEEPVIIGFGVLNPIKSEIEAVYVTPAKIRKGIGSQLLKIIEARAMEMGLTRLHLNASLNAVRFYQQAGYQAEPIGKFRLATGLEIACVPMQKSLTR